MIVILHVIIALASIGYTTYGYLRPSKKGLFVSYGFVAMTLASGMYLVVRAPSHMIEACTMGVAYLAIVSVGIIATRIKLVHLQASSVHIEQ